MTLFEWAVSIQLFINCVMLIYISHQLDDVNEVLRRPYVGNPMPILKQG